MVNNIRKVFETGYACWETRILTKSGEAIPFMLSGVRLEIENNVFALGMGVDIQKRVAIANELQFSNSLLNSLLENTLDGVLVVGPGNQIMLMNSRFKKMWSIPEEVAQLMDDNIQLKSVVNQIEDPDAFLARVNEIYRNRETVCREEIKLKDGRVFDRYTTPLLDHNGSYLGRVWYFRDITEDIIKEEEQLRHRKLESIGILAGGIAHDFNNILTAVIGNINMASILSPAGSDSVKFLKEAEKAALRAKDLTYKLLTFSKGGSPVKDTASIKQVLEDTVELCLSGSNIQPVFTFEPGLWTAIFDKEQIAQAVNNLIINAKESMPEGGQVNIECTNFRHEGNRIPNLDEGLYIKVAIADHGNGISPEDIDKIFDPYFTTRSLDNFKGRGLGLYIAHSIITRHGGTVTVKSVPGAGATFTFYVPSNGVPDEQKKAEPEAPEASRKILVMDDDPMVRKLALEMLTSLGYHAVCAEDGNEAISLFRKAQADGRPFDGLLLDLTIPGGRGGMEILQEIRKINPEIKAIVSSGYATDPVMTRYSNFGFDQVLQKPYRMNELAEVMNNLFRDD